MCNEWFRNLRGILLLEVRRAPPTGGRLGTLMGYKSNNKLEVILYSAKEISEGIRRIF